MKVLFKLWKIWFERTWIVFGIITGLIGLWGMQPCTKGKIIVLGSSVIISIIIAAFWTVCRKKRISFKLDEQTSLKVLYGNIWESQGIIVVGVNDYFDTHLGDGIVDAGTLHGQLIQNVFAGQEDVLREKIEDALNDPSNRYITGEYQGNNNRGEGLPTRRFELGTSVRISHNDKTYILAVISRFNETNRAKLKQSEYAMMIQGVFESIYNLSDNKAVYMPLLGSGRASTGMSNMQVLSAIVSQAQLAENINNQAGINVVIYETEDKPVNIKLNVIDYLYNKINLKTF